MSTKRSFEEWMKLVDAELDRRVYMTSEWMPDYGYRAAYELGRSPQATATSAIRNARYS